MSPPTRQRTPRIEATPELQQFAVSSNAFLPEDHPLKRLPDPYYAPWEMLASHLPEYVEAGRIRRAVDDLPVLSTDRLRSEPEWRRAYVMLAFLTHAYVWGGDQPEETLPPQITLPFLRVSSHLELPPVLTYAAANLWNFSCAGPDFSRLADLDTLVSFTGTRSESWFLLISVAMEAKAGAIIPSLMHALSTREPSDATLALDKLRVCVGGVGELLERMYEHCDPTEFYTRIRPFLAGSKNMESAGLPRGVFYDEGDGRGQWRQLRGGSNGQSSLIQLFDVVLGVQHKTGGDDEKKGSKGYHELVREYMPGPHARFLAHVAEKGSFKDLAEGAKGGSEEEDGLREAFSAATAALGAFRDKHIQIVTRYVILPSRRATAGSETARGKGSVGRQNLATSSARRDGKELTGTGGTTLVPFLKKTRDETVEAGRLEA